MVPLAWQPLPGVAAGRGSRVRPGWAGGEPRAAEAGEGRARVVQLHQGESAVHSELWGALSLRRGDLDRLRRVDRQPGDQQAHGEEATDALDAGRCPQPTPDSDPR